MKKENKVKKLVSSVPFHYPSLHATIILYQFLIFSIHLYPHTYKLLKFASLRTKIPRRREWQPTPVYPCLENSTDREAWWATVRGVTQSDTTEHAHTVGHTPKRKIAG